MQISKHQYTITVLDLKLCKRSNYKMFWQTAFDAASPSPFISRRRKTAVTFYRAHSARSRSSGRWNSADLGWCGDPDNFHFRDHRYFSYKCAFPQGVSDLIYHTVRWEFDIAGIRHWTLRVQDSYFSGRIRFGYSYSSLGVWQCRSKTLDTAGVRQLCFVRNKTLRV